ncbi:MAG TPA: VOC family protein [Fimbriimonadales bacterium]|nr:VOC family protein [Fimbriimonadales bacterium]
MKITEIALFCSDTNAVKEFFKKILGEPASEWHGGAIFHVGDVHLLVHEKSTSGGGPANMDHFAFEVENLEEACKNLEEKGLKPTHGPENYDWGKSAYYFDPEGRMIELHEV